MKIVRLLYYLPIERMKIEIEKSEYDRLKSREEKLMAYYEWFVDKENDLVTVEDIITENIELKKTKEAYKEMIEALQECITDLREIIANG